jgi:hypothetical protein
MNFSFVLSPTGEFSVAPMYDVFSTIAYPHLTTTPGMFIGGCRDIRAVGREHLRNEATSWGLSADEASRVIDSVPSEVAVALERAFS